MFFIFTKVVADQYQDSLKKELSKTTQIEKVGLLKYRLAESYLYLNVDSSKMLLDQSLEIAEVTSDSSLFANIYYFAGYLAYNTSNFDTAIYLFRKSFTYYDTIRDLDRYVNTKILFIDCEISNFDLDVAYKQLVKVEELPNLSLLDHIKITNLYANLFDRKKEYAKALPVFLKYLSVIDSIDEPIFQFQFYTNLGILYDNLEEFKTSEKYYLLASSISNDLGIDYYQIISGVSLALLYQRQQKWSKSVPFLKKACDYYYETQDWTEYAIHKYYLTTSYIFLQNEKQAKKCINELDKIIAKVNRPEVILEYYWIKANYYKSIKDYKAGYNNLELYKDYSDSLYNIKSIEELNNLIVKYKTEKKENEITILKQRVSIEQTARKHAIRFLAAIVIILLILIVVLFLYRKNVKHRRALNEEKTLRLQREKKLVEAEKEKFQNEKQLKELENRSLKQENKLLESQKEISNQKLQAHKNILSSTNNSLFNSLS